MSGEPPVIEQSGASPVRRGPGRPRHDGPTAAFVARQGEIIDTAIAVFHERGFDSGSLDDVAGSLGVSKASLYHYVPSKAHLLYLIFDRAISTTLARMHELAAVDDPAERVRALIRQQVATIAADQPMFRVFFGDRPALDDRYEVAVRTKEREFVGIFREAVAAAMDAGAIPAGDPRLTAQAILGMTNWFHQWYQEGRDDPDAFARTCIALVLTSERIAKDGWHSPFAETTREHAGMADAPAKFSDVAPPAGLPDISQWEFWTGDRVGRADAFRTLRQTPGLPFYPERVLADSPFDPGPGYYAVTRHDDVWHASRHPDLFCSGQGTNIPDLPQELNEFYGSMINMDDPKHFRLRSIVSKGFTPKHISAVEDQVRDQARRLVDAMLADHPERTADFVQAFAGPFPLRIICSMMGIPESDVDKIFEWTNVILGIGDPEFGGTYERLMEVSLEIFAYAQALGEARRAEPTDDITSAMMNAEVDGDQLTAQEFGSFFILLVVAGNETTRNAISHGLNALTGHPDQRDAWFSAFETHTRTAVEEIVRWATPVIHFRRTVTTDTELSGQQLHAGAKVVLFYESANRDEQVYEQADRFDVARPVNPAQVGFGAGGPHFCLGANLARREIAVAFDEIRRRLPELRVTGEPDYLQSNFINGIKRLPCAW